MKNQILSLSAILMLLWSCGKKGPLVLEPELLPPAPTQLELRQIGHEVELSWKYPALLSDNQTPLQPSQVRSVGVYHLAKPFSPGSFEKKSELLARPKAAEMTSSGDRHTVAIPFKTRMLKEKEHAFAVAYYYGRTRSPLGVVAKIATRPPPEAVRNLKIGREGKVVVLKWDPPRADSEGQPLPALLGYRAYRRIAAAAPAAKGAPEKGAGAFIPVNAKPIKGEYFEDHDTGKDGDYEYRVSSLLAERIESSPSVTVKINIQDTFPPDVPVNLVTFTAGNHVFLSWEAVRDRDLDHYVIFRRSITEKEFKILEASVAENFYRDPQVVKGREYIYAVAAVDRKGNESEPGRPARHKFE
jgi:predicted small lipoprotein YifL